ncbi:MAG: pantothenate kinase [Bacteroidetes bacterium 4572_112]|nr:MAG: pantothenate kinase [Bacteroidetes bacterium 4572_112]
MQLILDFGNTFQKCAVFDRENMISDIKFEKISLNDIVDYTNSFPNIKSCILSSVMNTPEDIIDYLNHKFDFIELNSKSLIPITNKYSTPDTLGKDRLAAAVAVCKLAKGKAALSIDIGTAIKFDLVNSDKEYLGGSISPGLFLRFKSLHTFTAKLPLVDYNNLHSLIGTDTQTSILSGVMNGAIAEVNAFIEIYKSQYEGILIFITGGESIYFVNHIKSKIFAVSNLVLIGLNEILLFNE